MSHTIRTNAEELNISEDLTENTGAEEVIAQETMKKPTLRERVFTAIEQLESQGIKPTRGKIRQLTGGSDRDLSKYMNEWRDSKKGTVDNETANTTNTSSALVVQVSNEIVQNKDENNIQNLEERVQTVTSFFNTVFSEDLDTASNIAEQRAMSIIVGQEVCTQNFLEDPSKLREDFKKEIAKVRNATSNKLNEISAKYEVSFFTKMVLSRSLTKE